MRSELEGLEGYEAGRAHVIAVDGERAEVFLGDALPAPGAGVWLHGPRGERALARVSAHLGAKRASVLALRAPAWLAPDLAVSVAGEDAALPAPSSPVWRLDEAELVLASAPGALALTRERADWLSLDPSRDALITGVPLLDTLAPIARGGLTAVIDEGDGAAFMALCERARAALGAGVRWVHLQARPDEPRPEGADVVIAPSGDIGHLWGVRASALWAASLRDAGHAPVLCTGALPALGAGWDETRQAAPGAPSGMPQVIAWLSETLASTRQGQLTGLWRIPLASHAVGLTALLESVSVGDADAQLHLDVAHRFVSASSRSRATRDDAHQRQRDVWEAARSRAASLQEKLAVWGEEELSEQELEALAIAATLERSDPLRA